MTILLHLCTAAIIYLSAKNLSPPQPSGTAQEHLYSRWKHKTTFIANRKQPKPYPLLLSPSCIMAFPISITQAYDALSRALSNCPYEAPLHTSLLTLSAPLCYASDFITTIDQIHWVESISAVISFATECHQVLIANQTSPLNLGPYLEELNRGALALHHKLESTGFYTAFLTPFHQAACMVNLCKCMNVHSEPFIIDGRSSQCSVESLVSVRQVLVSLPVLYTCLEAFFHSPALTVDLPTVVSSTLSQHQLSPKPLSRDAIVETPDTNRFLAVQLSFNEFVENIGHMPGTTLYKQRLYGFANNLWHKWTLNPSDVQVASPSSPVGIAGRIGASVNSIVVKAVMKSIDVVNAFGPVTVALKTFPMNSSDTQKQALFLQEALRLQTMPHPCIPVYYGAIWPVRMSPSNTSEQSTSEIVLATECMTHNLRSAVHHPALDGNVHRIRILRDIANGLAFLHTHRTSHCALSPENILLRIHEGKLFGCAKIDITTIVTRVLSYHRPNKRPFVYCPPEQLTNSSVTYFTGDVWSFGVLACFILAPCQEGEGDADIEYFRTMSAEGPMSLALKWANKIEGESIRTVVRQCLSHEPAERLTAEQLSNSISQILYNLENNINEPTPNIQNMVVEEIVTENGHTSKLEQSSTVEPLVCQGGVPVNNDEEMTAIEPVKGQEDVHVPDEQCEHPQNVGQHRKPEPVIFGKEKTTMEPEIGQGNVSVPDEQCEHPQNVGQSSRTEPVTCQKDVHSPDEQCSQKPSTTATRGQRDHHDATTWAPEADERSPQINGGRSPGVSLSKYGKASIGQQNHFKKFRKPPSAAQQIIRTGEESHVMKPCEEVPVSSSTVEVHQTTEPSSKSMARDPTDKSPNTFGDISDSAFKTGGDDSCENSVNEVGKRTFSVRKGCHKSSSPSKRRRVAGISVQSLISNTTVVKDEVLEANVRCSPSSEIVGHVASMPVPTSTSNVEPLHSSETDNEIHPNLKKNATKEENNVLSFHSSDTDNEIQPNLKKSSTKEANNTEHLHASKTDNEIQPNLKKNVTKEEPTLSNVMHMTHILNSDSEENHDVITPCQKGNSSKEDSQSQSESPLIEAQGSSKSDTDSYNGKKRSGLRRKRQRSDETEGCLFQPPSNSHTLPKVSCWEGRMRKRTLKASPEIPKSREPSPSPMARRRLSCLYDDLDSVCLSSDKEYDSDEYIEVSPDISRENMGSKNTAKEENCLFQKLPPAPSPLFDPPSRRSKRIKTEEDNTCGVTSTTGNDKRKEDDCLTDLRKDALRLGRRVMIDDYQSIASDSNTRAKVKLGLMYEKGISVTVDFSEAFFYYMQAANAGCHEGELRVGYCFKEGRGISVNKEEAASWFLKAADGNNHHAQFETGKCFVEGVGVEKNYGMAMKFFSSAVVQGHIGAHYHLAMLYENGNGVHEDKAEAFRLYNAASEAGNIASKVKAAHFYAKGTGVKRNIGKAVRLYRQAAAGGDPEAKLSLGLLHEDGNGVKRSAEIALRLYQESASMGFAPGQTALGQCYLWAYGLKQNIQKAVDLFRISSAKGHALALYELGNCYKEGKAVCQNYDEATRLYREAASKGSAVAYVQLGEFFYSGLGVEVCFEKAFKEFEKAAELGAAEGCRWLGDCYMDGSGVEKDITMAMEMYVKASELGSTSAETCLGSCYENGLGVERNKTKALYWYKKASENGNHTAMNNLGIFYEQGKLVKQDYKRAVSYYRKAIDSGSIEAICNLADCYRLGNGIAKCEKEAVKLYREATSHGSAGAQCELGICYYLGKGVAVDYEEAVSLFRKAAKSEPEAIRQLGTAYADGHGVEQDYKKAVEMYREAISKGNSDANMNLGHCYSEGAGVEKDEEKAAELFRKAAEGGCKLAMLCLGNRYFVGCGVEKDLNKAAKWLMEGEGAPLV